MRAGNQGVGTLVVNPTKLDNAYDAFIKLGLDVIYSQGYGKCKEKDSAVPDLEQWSLAFDTALRYCFRCETGYLAVKIP